MSRFVIILTFFLSINLNLSSQNLTFHNNYQHIQTNGVPEWLKDYIESEGMSLKNTLNSEFEENDASLKNDFIHSNIFNLKYQLSWGNILFDSDIEIYLNNLAHNVLSNNPDLQEKVKIYISRNSSVNAFAYPNGVILINIGLLRQLSSEAELAYVISHEASHILMNHSFKQYLNNKSIYKRKTYGNTERINANIDEVYNFSREQELEADQISANLMIEAGYDLKAVTSALRKLHYSHIPQKDLTVNPVFFNTGHLTFNSSYFLDKIDTLADIKLYNERYMTHPNIPERIAKIDSLQKIKGINSKKPVRNNNTAISFKQVQEIANFETLRYLIKEKKYSRAIYESYCILQQYPNNQFAQRIIVLAFYGLAKYKNANEFHLVAQPYTQVQLSSQQIHYFLKKVNQLELSILAYDKIIEYEKKYSVDNHLTVLQNDLLKDIYIKLDGLDYNHRKGSDIDTKIILEEIFNYSKNKEIMLELANEKRELEEHRKLTYKERIKAEALKNKDISKKGLGVKAKNIRFVNPQYFFIAKDKNGTETYQKSLANTLKLESMVNDVCSQQNIGAHFVNFSQTIASKEEYQCTSELSHWISELLMHKKFIDYPLVYKNSKSETDIIVCLNTIYWQSSNTTYYNFIAIKTDTGEIVYESKLKKNKILNSKNISKQLSNDIEILRL